MLRQLVGQHALQLGGSSWPAGRGRPAMAAFDGLRPVRTRSGVVLDDVDPRLGQPARDAQPLDKVVSRRTLAGRAGLLIINAIRSDSQ